MKTYEQIEEAFKAAIQSEEAVDETKVAEASDAVQAAGTEFFGPGVYVSGKLNYDMGGVSFRWKRPSIRQRYEIFVAAQLVERQDDIALGPVKDDPVVPVVPVAGVDTSETEDERLTLFKEAVLKLAEDEFTSSGLPQVDALNRNIDNENVQPFTAKERDLLWAQVKPTE